MPQNIDKEISALLQNKGLKRTHVRAKVLETLWDENKPMSAVEIMERMKIECDESTVFRTLNTFVEKRMLSVAAISERTKIYSLKRGKHSHYVTCRSCQHIDEINLCSVSPLLKRAEEMGFQSLQHRIEISGICQDCQV